MHATTLTPRQQQILEYIVARAKRGPVMVRELRCVFGRVGPVLRALESKVRIVMTKGAVAPIDRSTFKSPAKPRFDFWGRE